MKYDTYIEWNTICSPYKECSRAWPEVLGASNRHTKPGSLSRKGSIGRLTRGPFHNARGHHSHCVLSIASLPPRLSKLCNLEALPGYQVVCGNKRNQENRPRSPARIIWLGLHQRTLNTVSPYIRTSSVLRVRS